MNLSLKVISTLLLVLITTMAISGWVSVTEERNVLKSLLNTHGQSLSNTIAVVCIEPLLSEDYPVLNTFLETMGRERDDILSIEVVQNGKLVSNYVAGEQDPADRVLFNSDVLFAMQTDQPPIKLGEIRLGLSDLQNKKIMASRIREQILNTGFIFILLTGTLVLALRKMVLEKIRYLSEHARQIGAGNLDLKIDIRSDDELGNLADTFNEMVGTIKASQENLKKLAKSLQESEEKFRSISASAQDAIIMADAAGRISYWNEAAEQIFGYSNSEIMGQDISRIVSPKYSFEAYQEVLNGFKNTGQALFIGKILESTAIKKGGAQFPIELSTSAVKIKGNWNAIGIVRDITLRKKAEEELKHYQKHLETLVKARTRELEEAQEELVNKAMEAGRAQLAAMVLHNIGNAMTPVNVQIEGMKANQSAQIVVYLEKCYQELNAHRGELNQYVNEKERGKEVFRYLGELIDAIKEERERNGDAVDKIDRAIAYVAEILTLQQAYAAREQEIKQRVDLNSLIDDAIRMQMGGLERKGVTIKRDLNADLPKLLIDKNRLMQVIVNFIKNSSEALERLTSVKRKKMIHIKTFANNGRVGFEITDNGIGLDPEEIEHIFDFGKSYKGSSGFGLYYCKMFVEDNRGTLNITSPQKRKGARVTVIFAKQSLASV